MTTWLASTLAKTEVTAAAGVALRASAADGSISRKMTFGNAALVSAIQAATTALALTALGLGATDRVTHAGAILTQGALTDPAAGLSHTATWNDAADTFTGIFSNITDTASAAASRLLTLQVGGVDRFFVTKTGRPTFANTGAMILTLTSSTGDFSTTGVTYFSLNDANGAQGVIGFAGAANNMQFANALASGTQRWLNGSVEYMHLGATGLLSFQGQTSSFPALKRSTTILQARLADDSNFAPLQGLLRTAANAVTGLTGGVLAATTNASLVITDASGQAYRVPCII